MKAHRRDDFIEWIKSLLAVPFVLHGVHGTSITGEETGSIIRNKYMETFKDIEKLLDDDIIVSQQGKPQLSRLRQLVPSIGTMWTRLPLQEAFAIEDERRSISERRFVSPSFNDVRAILRTAQVIELTKHNDKALKLITFDGDVTLYDDGQCLAHDSPIVEKLIGLLKHSIHVGIVTAAGYSSNTGEKYYLRLSGLLDAVHDCEDLSPEQKKGLYIMGGESNFLFQFSDDSQYRLTYIPKDEWMLEDMKNWTLEEIQTFLDVAEQSLTNLKNKLRLDYALIIRKKKSIGIIAKPGTKIIREILEEIVLSVQKRLENHELAKKIFFCAFNGGSDVWIDIGDKSFGVRSLQKYLGGINPSETLHVGDQFLSVGANDFKARLVACTAWIASPAETEECISDILAWNHS